MIPIGLQYSNDKGSTFSTALILAATKLRVYEVNEAENGTISVTGRKFPRKFTYLFVTMEIDMDYFDPSNATHGASANANLTALENICAAKLIRLYNNDTTNFPTWDTHTEFNVSTNTNYLLLERNQPNFLDMDGAGASGKKRRTMLIELITRSAV